MTNLYFLKNIFAVSSVSFSMKYFLILFSLYLTSALMAEIPDIPRKDLKNIKDLFEQLIEQHDYSYAIFGSKPMSLCDFCLETPRDLPFHKRIKSYISMVKRKVILNSWYKYRDTFDFKDFIFLDKESDWINCLTLILINKKNMLRVLNAHDSIFKEELGESFTPESFLEKLEKREISIAQATKKNQKLMGIMLGYGVRNATLFQERYDIMKTLWKREQENLSEDQALTKQLATIEAQCGNFNDLETDALIHPLYFLADISHPETIALRQKYEAERQRIIRLRQRPDFMDLVLQRLNGS